MFLKCVNLIKWKFKFKEWLCECWSEVNVAISVLLCSPQAKGKKDIRAISF
jgi:hypothetical protein